MTHTGDRPSGNQVHSLAQHPARLFQRAFEHSQSGMVITNASGTILHANDAFCTFTGRDRNGIVGTEIARFFVSLRPLTPSPPFRHAPSEHVHTGPHEVVYRRAEGESLSLLMTIDPLLDEKRQPDHFLYTFIQLNDAKSAALEERHWLHVDPLTGLPNWLLLRDRLSHAMAQAERAESTVALLYIDIDRFKTVNDSVGHDEGDRILAELARRLHQEVRSKDTLARLGSDQFVVLLEKEGNAEAAQVVAERLQEALEPPFVSGEHFLLVTASIGIALYPSDAQDTDSLISAARNAMFTARKKGPGRLAFVDHQLTLRLKEKHRLESLLSEAVHLPEQYLTLHYQPEFNREEGHCTGLEAVLRWKQPQRWKHPPTHYLDLMTRLGLCVRLNRWMIEQVIADHYQWLNDALPLGELPISLPLCESHLLDRHDYQPLDHFLRRFQQQRNIASLSWLTLNVPAHGLSNDLDSAAHMLKRLEQLGIRLAVDKLGSSPADLAWLSRLYLHKATLDARLAGTEHGLKLLEALCRMLDALNIKPIIIGVDSETLAARLGQIGARRVQGDHYCPPMPAEALQKRLELAVLPNT